MRGPEQEKVYGCLGQRQDKPTPLATKKRAPFALVSSQRKARMAMSEHTP